MSHRSDNPLSIQNLLAGVIVAVIGGIIVAYIIQDARFDPIRLTPEPVISSSTPSMSFPTAKSEYSMPTPTLVSTVNQKGKPIGNTFIQDFNSSDHNYDKSVQTCTDGNCDDKNMFQENGRLVFRFSESDTWGGILQSQAKFKPEDLVSIEAKLLLPASTRGGAWIGIDSEGWQGVEKDGNCSISVIKAEDTTPHIGCNVTIDESSAYITPDLFVKYDTWYTVRIDFDPVTQEQSYYLDGDLIGQFSPKISTDPVSVILGVWRDGDNPVDAYIDEIFVRTKS